MTPHTLDQKKTCRKYHSKFVESPLGLKVGIAENVKKNKLQPLNGLRHPPEGDTTGWYLWRGKKFSRSPDFFKPMHVKHLQELCPEALKFLGLAPGFRFLIDDKDVEDVWYDPSLLEI